MCCVYVKWSFILSYAYNIFLFFHSLFEIFLLLFSYFYFDSKAQRVEDNVSAGK